MHIEPLSRGSGFVVLGDPRRDGLFQRILRLHLYWGRMQERMPASCILGSKPESRVNQFVNSALERDR